MQHRRAGDDVATEELDQWHQRRRCRTDPVRQRRGLERHALSSVDLGLAIQGKVIVELRHDDVSEKPRAGAAPCDRVMRRRRLDDALARAAREGFAHVAHHLEAPGNVVERLGTGTRSQRSFPTSRAPSALASSGSSPTLGTRATMHRPTSASKSTWRVRGEGSPPPSNARSAGARPWSPRSVTSRTSTGWGATTWPGELAMQPTSCSRRWATTSASSSGGSLFCCASSWPSSQPQATRTGPSQRPDRSYFTGDDSSSFRKGANVFVTS